MKVSKRMLVFSRLSTLVNSKVLTLQKKILTKVHRWPPWDIEWSSGADKGAWVTYWAKTKLGLGLSTTIHHLFIQWINQRLFFTLLVDFFSLLNISLECSIDVMQLYLLGVGSIKMSCMAREKWEKIFALLLNSN